MNSTATSQANEPNDILVARADERLAHAYEQIARADDQLARVTEQLSKLERDSTHHPAAGGRPSRGRPALRGLFGLLLTSCIVGLAFVSQASDGGADRPIIARWASQLVPTWSVQLARPRLPEQPSPPSIQVAAADAISPHAIYSAQSAPQDVAPAAAPVSSEMMELLQTVVQTLSRVEQGIEHLKASQAQAASDNVKEVEQLKASQEQITRLMAKASEQTLRPRTPAAAQPIVAATKRVPVQSPEARTPAQIPMQLQPKPQ